jgi:hypothetical protein
MAARTQRLVKGWPTVSLGFSGKNVVLAESTAPRIVPGGYTVFRTDTFRLRLTGDRLNGRVTPDIVFRTSAGLTTGGPIFGDTTGRYIIIATGRGFPTQPVFCCTRTPRDIPLEPDGRTNAPRTIAATLDGPVAHYVLANPDGTHTFVSYTVSDDPGQPLFQRIARPLTGDAPSLAAMAPGILATVDRATGKSIRLTTTASGIYDPLGELILPPQAGVVKRLHVTRSMVVALLRTTSGFQLVRMDAPLWQPKIIWRGTRPPALTAAGDRTVVYATNNVVTQSVPGRRRELLRLRGKIVALATDGRRVAIANRSQRGKPRKTAIIVASVLQPPGVYSPGGAP